VSVIPKEIPDFGSSQLAPRQNPEFKPGAGFTTEEYFVWSRLDGQTSLREVILMVNLGIEKSIGILRKLRRSGAVLLPGEESRAVSGGISGAATATRIPKAEKTGTATRIPKAEKTEKSVPVVAAAAEPEEIDLPDLGALSPDEEAALAEDVALQEREKRRIIQVMRLVAGGDYFAVLGVPRTAEKRELRRAYFRLSKEFHPDRHYKQNLGSFGPLLSIIFKTATEAFQELNDDDGRAAHLGELTGEPAAPRARTVPGPENTGATARITGQTSAQPGAARSPEAADLFVRACEREVGGDAAGALRMFRAAIKIDPQPRYLRRATRCALGFGQLSEAEGYAHKAMSLRPDDGSYARLLADVLRAGGRLEEAEMTLLRALDLPSTGDSLGRELQVDLAAVRAALAARLPQD